MKAIKYMDVSFRDGFQSCLGARVKTEDFLPALEAAAEAGTDHFEIGGGARFQSLYFYCQEDAFDMMDKCRELVGKNINLQTLARGANVVGLVSQSRDIIDLHAKMFKKHGVSTIRNFDALNDVRNLNYSGRCIHNHGLKHQISITLMGLPPGLNEKYAHTSDFYADKAKEILEADIPFNSICLKDASGTSTPKTVFETVKKVRDIIPEDIDVHFHTHATGGTAANCLMSAIEAGADLIDMAMAPCSGGTSHVDILTMWHALRGSDYVLTNSKGKEIDFEAIFKAEEKFKECMEPYYFGHEAKETNPLIVLSPMPGGALTANTQMMRDNNCMNLYNDVIKAMREVVAKGGFGTSVTPVSQFYFQQAFANVTQGNWKKITDGYGKMVLGYFGATPAEPDPEIVKLASEQLGLEPTKEDVHDINDKNPELGIKPAEKKLKDAGLEITDENLMIAATCGDKGIAFLNGEKPYGIRYKKDMEQSQTQKPAEKTSKERSQRKSDSGDYTVTVDGKRFNVNVTAGKSTVTPSSSNQVPQSEATPSEGGEMLEQQAPMPGTVLKIVTDEGQMIESGDPILILEAMKMEQPVKAEKSGKIVELMASQGQSVAAGDVIALIEET